MSDTLADPRAIAFSGATAAILDAHGVRRASLFGSVARGDARPDSDVDILVELERGRTLLDLVALKRELEAVFGRPADVVTFNALHPALREAVLREQVPLR